MDCSPPEEGEFKEEEEAEMMDDFLDSETERAAAEVGLEQIEGLPTTEESPEKTTDNQEPKEAEKREIADTELEEEKPAIAEADSEKMELEVGNQVEMTTSGSESPFNSPETEPVAPVVSAGVEPSRIAEDLKALERMKFEFEMEKARHLAEIAAQKEVLERERKRVAQDSALSMPGRFMEATEENILEFASKIQRPFTFAELRRYFPGINMKIWNDLLNSKRM